MLIPTWYKLFKIIFFVFKKQKNYYYLIQITKSFKYYNFFKELLANITSNLAQALNIHWIMGVPFVLNHFIWKQTDNAYLIQGLVQTRQIIKFWEII